mgnify:FL=1
MMLIVILFVLIFTGFYLLFLLSEKQLKKTAQSRFQIILKYRKLTRFSAYLCFLCGFYLSISMYGFSIGFISSWIFASPIIFALILCNNRLKKPLKL